MRLLPPFERKHAVKKPEIGVFHPDRDRSRLESILQRLGFGVIAFSRADQLLAALTEKPPGTLLIARKLLPKAGPALRERLQLLSASGRSPTIVLSGSGKAGEPFDLPHEALEEPFDIFALHEALKKGAGGYSRRHLRIPVQLPGLFSFAGVSLLGDILSLGTGGAFIKSSCGAARKGETLEIVIPLLGMKKELEIPGQVVYQAHPRQENNFMQGFGLRFVGLDLEAARSLEGYISHCLLEEFPEQAATSFSSPGPDTPQIGPERSRKKSYSLSLGT